MTIPPDQLRRWVAPFGDPGINDRSHLPRAFRSVPRPSSPLSAKASTRCPSFARDPQAPDQRRSQNTAAHSGQPQTRPHRNPPTENNPRTAGPETRAHAASHEDASLGPPTPGPGPLGAGTAGPAARPSQPDRPAPRPRRSASVTFTNPLHPSINAAPGTPSTRGARAGQTRHKPASSPNVAAIRPRIQPRSRSARADPGCRRVPESGGERDRTDDLLLAKQALSQLSYTPRFTQTGDPCRWWAREDLNLRPHAYQARALTS